MDFPQYIRHLQHYWVWYVNNLVNDHFSGSRIGFDTILESGLDLI